MPAKTLPAAAQRAPRVDFSIVFSASLFAALLPGLFYSPAAQAQGAQSGSDVAQAIQIPPVVVGATKLPTPVDELGTSVTVITAEDLEKTQQRSLPDALRAVPGLNLVQNGGPGGSASVYTRGTNANHTKVLVDGIDVSDPSATNGTFDYAHMLTIDIDRVEVLRGQQSGLYGSDAIGGVINIITKSGKGPARAKLTAEGGSFGTFNQMASVSGGGERYDYAFNLAHVSVRNSPVTPPELVPPGRPVNDDSYANTTVSTKLGAALTDNFNVGLVARFIDTSLQYTVDDFSGPNGTRSDGDTRQFFSRATGKLSLFEGLFDQTVGLALTDYRRRDTSPGFDDLNNHGRRIKGDWQGDVKLTPDHTLSLGLEKQRDELVDRPISAQNDNQAGFVQIQAGFFDRLFVAASLRHDDNEMFGGATTYRVAPALLIPETGSKLKGSVATGFRAPSLDQLFVDFPAFGFFANPNLQPEKSDGWDFGFEQSLGKSVQFGATYFRNNVENLIVINDSFTTLENIGNAKIYGVESFVAVQPLDDLKLRADYTYTVAEDATDNELLLRRPKHKASLTAQWQATNVFNLALTVVYVGPRLGGNRDFSVQRLESDPYTLVNLAGAYAINETVTAFGRIENLFNQDYQDPEGFMRPGIGFFAGLSVAFNVADLK